MAESKDKMVSTKTVVEYPKKVLPGDEVAFKFSTATKHHKAGQEVIMHRVRALKFTEQGKGEIVRAEPRKVRTPNQGEPKK